MLIEPYIDNGGQVRYCRQLDYVSCGPICILNCLKWSGIDVTSQSHLPYLQFSCRTIDLEEPEDPDNNGTFDSDFDRVLRYVGKGVFNVRRQRFPTAEEIREHLESGGAVAISYHWEEDGQVGDHFCFISGMKRGFFECVNDHHSSYESTVSLRRIITLRTWLKKYDDCPTAWFLTME